MVRSSFSICPSVYTGSQDGGFDDHSVNCYSRDTLEPSSWADSDFYLLVMVLVFRYCDQRLGQSTFREGWSGLTTQVDSVMIRAFRQQDPGSAGPIAPIEKKKVMSPGAQLTVCPLHLSTGNATHNGRVFLPQGREKKEERREEERERD